MNPYQVLGLDWGADRSAIKQAYRGLCLQYHPDKAGQTQESQAAFIKIHEAYTWLLDHTVDDPETPASSTFVKGTEGQGTRNQGGSGANPRSSGSIKEFRSQDESKKAIEGIARSLEELKNDFNTLCNRYESYPSGPKEKAWVALKHIWDDIEDRGLQAQELLRQVVTWEEGKWENTPEVNGFLDSVYRLRQDAGTMRGKLHIFGRTLRFVGLSRGRETLKLIRLFQDQLGRW